MALAARIRRLSLVIAAIGVLATPARGGDRTPSGCTEESLARPRSATSGEACATPAATARNPRTSVNPTDDGYVPRAKAAVLAPTPASPPSASELGSAPPAARAVAPDAAARRREAPAGVQRTARQAPQRTKVSMRNLPAAPGMGTLLRVGVTAGREISWLDDLPLAAPARSHSGRAPPRAGADTHPAPAALPAAPPTAAELAGTPPADAAPFPPTTRAIDRSFSRCTRADGAFAHAVAGAVAGRRAGIGQTGAWGSASRFPAPPRFAA